MSELGLGDPLTTHIQHDARTAVGSGYGPRSSSSSLSLPNGGQRWRPSVFDFKAYRSGSTCPTCKGAGRIPKGQEDELVALIPYNDKRLKPRRTCLYVSLMALLLILTGGVLTAFLYPRLVLVQVVSSTNATISGNDSYWIIENNQTYDMTLEIETIVKVKNSNFYPVTVSVMNVSLAFYENEVGLKSYPTFTVKSRSSQQVNVKQMARFTTPQSEKIHLICIETHQWSRVIYIKASAVAQYSYLVHQTSTSIGEQGSYVLCAGATPAVPVATILPPSGDQIT